MATERNPFDTMPEVNETNVVAMMPEENANVSIEIDPSDGGVIVDFSSEEEETTMKPSEEISEWYGDLSQDLDEEELQDIASDVIENFNADRDSRGEWESMFERGFDLLGLKLEEASEPFQGACTAVHPLLIESAVKFQSKATQELFPPAGS